MVFLESTISIFELLRKVFVNRYCPECCSVRFFIVVISWIIIESYQRTQTLHPMACVEQPVEYRKGFLRFSALQKCLDFRFFSANSNRGLTHLSICGPHFPARVPGSGKSWDKSNTVPPRPLRWCKPTQRPATMGGCRRLIQMHFHVLKVFILAIGRWEKRRVVV